MHIRKLLLVLSLVLVGLFLTTPMLAQPGPGGGRPCDEPPCGPPGDPDPPRVPITGIEVLLLAGAAFGVKKMADGRKKG